MEECWLSQTQEGQREQINPQTFDDPFLFIFFFFDSTGMIYMYWVPTGQTVNTEYYVEVLREFRKRFRQKRPALYQSAQWHFHQDNTPSPTTPSLSQTIWPRWASRQFLSVPIIQTLLPVTFGYSVSLEAVVMRQLRRMKETVTKVIDTLSQEDFDGAFQKLLERYNKCIAAGGDYFEGD